MLTLDAYLDLRNEKIVREKLLRIMAAHNLWYFLPHVRILDKPIYAFEEGANLAARIVQMRDAARIILGHTSKKSCLMLGAWEETITLPAQNPIEATFILPMLHAADNRTAICLIMLDSLGSAIPYAAGAPYREAFQEGDRRLEGAEVLPEQAIFLSNIGHALVNAYIESLRQQRHLYHVVPSMLPHEKERLLRRAH